jgi:hypothetical protein
MRAHGWRSIGVALGAVALLALADGRLAAAPSGTLVITDHQLDPKSKTLEQELNKAKKASLSKSGEGWHLYFVAYLKKAAGATEVNLVFYEMSGGKREQINAFPIKTQADAKILMSDAEISTEQGFKAGKKYQVLITRLIGGKEDVYARANLELR